MTSIGLSRYLSYDAKAIIYKEYGEPSEKIIVHDYKVESIKNDNEVLLELIAHPINPSDINQIQGVYPSKPELSVNLFNDESEVLKEASAICGNEGVFKVVEIGKNVKGFAQNDWVIPLFPNFGTWRTHVKLDMKGEAKLFNLNKENEKTKRFAEGNGGLSVNQAATISVNPCTALQMITKFLKLEEGDWVIQNGANSSVGKFVIQVCKNLKINSINLVRDKSSEENPQYLDELKSELKDLGADVVVSLSEAKEDRKLIKKLVKDVKENNTGKVKLGLNCVGGESCIPLIKTLDENGYLVTYGGMSKKPVILSTSSLIFKNLTSKGFWITRNNFQDPEEKQQTLDQIVHFYQNKQLVDAKSTHNIWKKGIAPSEVLALYQKALSNSSKNIVVYE
ncbi:enoyl-[acyl-carrier-protein] reductase [Ascoidea rubescens DSM 1968]|uniref:NAD(P)-binding protein n=1 Tax=Ascoidea rubescens DSM 1968 TaxID=1344418 RepID=A0A1D2VHZ2_9ASCO|nr:NAD(P)-binding protein [Ascoidea rubescens DSM 1968]ODV61097.1 NAD(P)-binding protein [Ascoidea rubescens DSM 1968]